jgi:CRP-like cAMP-binding protein
MEKLKHFLDTIEKLPPEEWEHTVELFKKEKIEKDQYFVKSNQICNKVAFIESGLFKLYYVIDGEEKIMLFFNENQFVADYYSFLTNTPSIRPIQAIENSIVYTISKDSLETLFEQYKKWEKIGRLLAERSYVYAVQRANRLIHDDYETLFKTFLEEHPTLIQRVPQFMIASYLNMKPETLSRVKKRLLKKGEISLKSIHDPLDSDFI